METADEPAVRPGVAPVVVAQEATRRDQGHAGGMWRAGTGHSPSAGNTSFNPASLTRERALTGPIRCVGS